jgi:tRNA splicing ligase
MVKELLNWLGKTPPWLVPSHPKNDKIVEIFRMSILHATIMHKI